jgi:hypothetical protein
LDEIGGVSVAASVDPGIQGLISSTKRVRANLVLQQGLDDDSEQPGDFLLVSPVEP